jgi:hypothetical protein
VTIVIIICIILAIAVLALILTPAGRAIRTHPRNLRASRPYRRPGPPDGEG